MAGKLFKYSYTSSRFINALKCKSSSSIQNLNYSSAKMKIKINELCIDKRTFATSSKEGLKNQDQGCSGPKLTKEERLAKTQREKTPAGKLESEEGGVKHPYQEKEPLEPHPGGVNPTTGEIGGPRGPEPTRFGDWERKGRVTDF